MEGKRRFVSATGEEKGGIDSRGPPPPAERDGGKKKEREQIRVGTPELV